MISVKKNCDCSKEQIQNTDCCTKPRNEVMKTRHHTGMSKKYFTRLEDKLKHDQRMREESCCN